MADPASVLAAWARIWSPVVPAPLQREAWEALSLPEDFEPSAPAMTECFHSGLPAPRVPLLLHAALGQDGAASRDTWVRIMEHLALEWQEVTLPPDHLAVACEALACAHARREEVLISEVPTRFLLPWCELACSRLSETPLAFLPERFAGDLRSIANTAYPDRGG